MSKNSSHRRNERGIQVLAKNIRKYRNLKGITIQELANQLDVDYSQISRMERSVVNPSISIVFDIADLLGIKAEKLLEE